ncbi:SDR family oxidoreductase [Nocardioides iriomotensis]|uniref:SDR family oxidoreductase n=1 Tax=Nocardioides iriomotensis TaxID=715784 RepID=A0A4V1Z158_9ACTN|nr:SDR family oxidoreductase [Nocardioides iriomotensis]
MTCGAGSARPGCAGEAHARRLASAGAKVVLTDLNADLGQQVADSIDGAAVFVQHDVTDPASWAQVVEIARETYGIPNVLVNNAGYAGPEVKAADFSDADYLRTIAIDQHGVFYGMRAVIPGMLEVGGGSIVNISSTAGFQHKPDTPNLAYTSAKFAVRGMTKAVAAEYGASNIRVNSVHPGGILTKMLVDTVPEELRNQIAAASIPMQRFGDPDEVSALVAFLASDESSYIHGTELVADGGQLAI